MPGEAQCWAGYWEPLSAGGVYKEVLQHLSIPANQLSPPNPNQAIPHLRQDRGHHTRCATSSSHKTDSETTPHKSFSKSRALVILIETFQEEHPLLNNCILGKALPCDKCARGWSKVSLPPARTQIIKRRSSQRRVYFGLSVLLLERSPGRQRHLLPPLQGLQIQ